MTTTTTKDHHSIKLSSTNNLSLPLPLVIKFVFINFLLSAFQAFPGDSTPTIKKIILNLFQSLVSVERSIEFGSSSAAWGLLLYWIKRVVAVVKGTGPDQGQDWATGGVFVLLKKSHNIQYKILYIWWLMASPHPLIFVPCASQSTLFPNIFFI